MADPLAAERIIKAAVENFGRVDCVVNNAGILRDRIFHRMSAVDWDAVIKVHLYGAFYMSKAAAPYFKEQELGSFIHFTSTSGLVGNFGQANYAAAKMGIVGLSKSIALDMARFKVRSNCISPFAWSRLIGTIPTETPEQQARVERIQNTMTASKIAPICVFLASDLSKDVTGQIFAVRKDEVFLMSQPRPLRVAHKEGGWTPQSIAETMLPAFKSAFSGTGKRGIVMASVQNKIVERALLDCLQDRSHYVRQVLEVPTSIGGVPFRSVPHGLAEIEQAFDGGKLWFARSDITGFFDNIPRAVVLAEIGKHVDDVKFLSLLDPATSVVLGNELALGDDRRCFPTDEQGVAQGSPLSPLLGNILLHPLHRRFSALGGRGGQSCQGVW